MNDIDERLNDLLTRSADAVDVRHDLDAVLDDDVVIDVTGRAGDRPRRVAFALTAAAILVVATITAVALAGSRSDDTVGVADGPGRPVERYPVLEVIPGGLTGRVVARGGPLGDVSLTYLDMFAEGTPVVRAVVGRTDDGPDETVSSLALLQAVPGHLADVFPGARSQTIGERPAEVLVDERTASTQVSIIGDGATLVAQGDETLLDLLAALDGLRLGLVEGQPVLDPGPLPPGVELLLPPGPVEGGEGAEVTVGELGAPAVTVATGFDDPLAIVAQTGSTAAVVDIGGEPGWITDLDEGGSLVAWRAPGGVTLLAQGQLSPEDTLLVARGVRLVDEATWSATYGGGPDGIPVDEATTVPSGGAAGDPTPGTDRPPTTAGERTGDEAEIDAAFHTAFDAGIPEEERFAVVEDGPALVEAGREAIARFPAAADSISVTVHSIEAAGSDRATVVFELVYDDAQPLGPQRGEAVRIDGVWKVSRETRCAIIRQAGVACP